MPRRSPKEARRFASRHFDRIRKNIDWAFNYGDLVAIRTIVRFDDSDATHCIRCWDDVRAEATDSSCPSCQGSGWISEETLTGYRFRVFSRAHIADINDQLSRTISGQEFVVRARFWVNFTERKLKDGDLIALVEPDDIMNPREIQEIIQFYEVISSKSHTLRSGKVTGSEYSSQHEQSNSNLLAQEVDCRWIEGSLSESAVDMSENFRIYQLLGHVPYQVQYSEWVSWIND